MTHPDVSEELAAALRLAAQLASQYAEHIARRVQEQARLAEAGHRHSAEQLRARLTAERDAARAAVAPTTVPAWWETATRAQVAHTWETARAWADTDPRLASTAAVLEAEIRGRYGIDAHQLWAEARRDLPAERAEAATVLAADTTAARVEEVAREVRHTDPGFPAEREDPGTVDLLAGWAADWDTPAARDERAAAARVAAGADVEAADAVTTADLSAGTPPQAAVARAGTAPRKARRWGRGKGAEVEVGR